MRRLANFIEIVLLILMILLCYVSISSARGNVPYIAGYRVLRVISNSMKPTIKDGTCIIIQKVDAQDVQVGDIITFVSNDPQIKGFYNTHRVYEIQEDEISHEPIFVTKGDANDYPDAYTVDASQVVGRYVKELPFGKQIYDVTMFLSQQTTYFIIVIFPLMLCLLSYLRQLMKAIAGKKEGV